MRRLFLRVGGRGLASLQVAAALGLLLVVWIVFVGSRRDEEGHLRTVLVSTTTCQIKTIFEKNNLISFPGQC